MLARRRLREVAPRRYAQLAAASALSLYLIVITGAAVRLTGSGLACESWPGCQEGAFFPAVGTHSAIEFGNRAFALFPIVLSLVAWIAAYRVPGLSRWAVWVAALVFLGTIGQAPLGLLTIRLDLHPLMVLTHFLLALVVLAGAVVLVVESWGNAAGRADSPLSLLAAPAQPGARARLRDPGRDRDALDRLRPASRGQRRHRPLLEPPRRHVAARPRDRRVRALVPRPPRVPRPRAAIASGASCTARSRCSACWLCRWRSVRSSGGTSSRGGWCSCTSGWRRRSGRGRWVS